MTALGSSVAWSEWSARHRRYVLVLRRGQTTTRPRVPLRRQAFDADLGTDLRGRQNLVYTRCRHPRPGIGSDLEFPNVSSGCRIFMYRVGARRETRLRVPEGRIVAPSLAGDSIVFGRQKQPGGRVTIVRRQLDGGPETVLNRGRSGERPVTIDAGPGRAVVSWVQDAVDAATCNDDVRVTDDPLRTRLALVIGRRATTLAQGCFTSPLSLAVFGSFTGQNVSFFQQRFDQPAAQAFTLQTVNKTGTHLATTSLPDRSPYWLQASSSAVVFSIGTNGSSQVTIASVPLIRQ